MDSEKQVGGTIVETYPKDTEGGRDTHEESTVRKENKVTRSPKGHRKGIDPAKVQRLAEKGLSTREIGKVVGCDHALVVRIMKRYGIEKAEVEEYKEHRAQILAGMQHRLLKSVTDEEIQKMAPYARIVASGILFDKERLETGRTSLNIGSFDVVIARIEEKRRKEALERTSVKAESQGDAVSQTKADCREGTGARKGVSEEVSE